MAFVNQSSAANFTPQKIKVLKVLCQQCFQESGTTILPVTLGAAITPADLELLEELLRTAGKTGPQATKARFWSFTTLRRLLLTSGRILAQSAVGHVAGEFAESSVLLERLTKLLVQGEAAVTEFITDLPASSREALLAIIERLGDGQGQ
jgi:hypothetical protein